MFAYIYSFAQPIVRDTAAILVIMTTRMAHWLVVDSVEKGCLSVGSERVRKVLTRMGKGVVAVTFSSHDEQRKMLLLGLAGT